MLYDKKMDFVPRKVIICLQFKNCGDGITSIIVLDESGDLGSKGTKYFTMVALVTFRARHLKPAYKLLQNKNFEIKWHNSSENFRKNMLKTMNNCQFSAVSFTINKNHPLTKKNVYGNDLYEIALRQVLADALSYAPCKDVNVYLDRNRFITEKKFREIVSSECNKYGINLKNVGFKNSNDTPCIQLADFIAGAVHANSEHNDDSLSIIAGKLSVARRY